MFKIKYLSIYSLLIAQMAFTHQKSGMLTINTSDYNNDKGHAILFLFRKDDKIPSNPFKTISAAIKDKKAIFEVQNLAFDDYAAIILHDENDNGKIDHSIGFPSEQLGYSNIWELGFLTGMPTFPKLKFQFLPTITTQSISITYKKNKK